MHIQKTPLTFNNNIDDPTSIYAADGRACAWFLQKEGISSWICLHFHLAPAALAYWHALKPHVCDKWPSIEQCPVWSQKWIIDIVMILGTQCSDCCTRFVFVYAQSKPASRPPARTSLICVTLCPKECRVWLRFCSYPEGLCASKCGTFQTVGWFEAALWQVRFFLSVATLYKSHSGD